MDKSIDYEDMGVKQRLVAHYGLQKLGEQEPYFAITADLYDFSERRGRFILSSCGCLHELIVKRMPELIPLIRWHLTFVNRGPIYYLDNGMFWFERSLLGNPTPAYKGDWTAYGDKALELFKKTIVYGASEEYDRIEESILKYRTDTEACKGFIRAWLEERLPEVMRQFHADMNRFNLDMNQFA